jgi:acyl-CoA synthetase (AMP-forming)/AMP-acid ligase II
MFPMPVTIHEQLELATDRFGEREVIRAGDDTWSFRQLDDVSNAFARHLTEQGVRPGDRVAVMSANRVEFIVAVEAVSKLGAASVLLSPAWKATEVGHALDLTGPVHAVADGDPASLLAELLGGAHVTDLDDATRDPFDYSPTRSETNPVPVDAEAILVFSSGTTGLPKAVRHTHRTMGHATAHWCERSGSAPMTASRWRRHRRTFWDCSTSWPPSRPVPPSGCTGASTSTRCCTGLRPRK